MALEDNGQSKGFAFVEFEDEVRLTSRLSTHICQLMPVLFRKTRRLPSVLTTMNLRSDG